MKILKICRECNQYTMKANCKRCKSETRTAHPAKFSIQDKYAVYRRQFL